MKGNSIIKENEISKTKIGPTMKNCMKTRVNPLGEEGGPDISQSKKKEFDKRKI